MGGLPRPLGMLLETSRKGARVDLGNIQVLKANHKRLVIQNIAATAQEQSESVEKVTASIDDVSAISEESQQVQRKPQPLHKSRQHRWSVQNN